MRPGPPHTVIKIPGSKIESLRSKKCCKFVLYCALEPSNKRNKHSNTQFSWNILLRAAEGVQKFNLGEGGRLNLLQDLHIIVANHCVQLRVAQRASQLRSEPMCELWNEDELGYFRMIPPHLKIIPRDTETQAVLSCGVSTNPFTRPLTVWTSTILLAKENEFNIPHKHVIISKWLEDTTTQWIISTETPCFECKGCAWSRNCTHMSSRKTLAARKRGGTLALNKTRLHVCQSLCVHTCAYMSTSIFRPRLSTCSPTTIAKGREYRYFRPQLFFT